MSDIENQHERLTQIIKETFNFGEQNAKVIQLGRPKAKHYRQFLKKLKNAKQK